MQKVNHKYRMTLLSLMPPALVLSKLGDSVITIMWPLAGRGITYIQANVKYSCRFLLDHRQRLIADARILQGQPNSDVR